MRRVTSTRSFLRYCVLVAAAVCLMLLLFAAWEYIPVLQQRQVCCSHLADLRHALLKYRDVRSSEPASFELLVQEGFTVEASGQCPFEADARGTHCDYAWVVGILKGDPGHWPVAFDRKGNHGDGTRHVVFVSGRVALLKEAEFAQMLDGFRREFLQRKKRDPVVHRDATGSGS